MIEPVFADGEARFPDANWPSRLRLIAPLFNEMAARAEWASLSYARKQLTGDALRDGRNLQSFANKDQGA